MQFVAWGLEAFLVWFVFGWLGLFVRGRWWDDSLVKPVHLGRRRMMVFVPARDEGEVLLRPVPELVAQAREFNAHAGWEQVEVYVVADGGFACDVEVANRVGARCVVVDSGGMGKHLALAQAWEQVRLGDALGALIVDADNRVGPELVWESVWFLRRGGHVGQARLRTLTAVGWVGRAIMAGYEGTEVFWQRLRSYWGAVMAGGSGMVLSRDLLDLGPGISLTDDLEWTVREVLRGGRTYRLHAWVEDEKPESLVAAIRQRVRWMRGQMTVLRVYGLRLLGRGWRGVDLLLYLMSIWPLAVSWGLMLLVLLVAPEAVLVSLLIGGVVALAAQLRGGQGARPLLLSSLGWAAFALMWPVAVWIAFLTGGEKWRATKHRVAG